MDTTSTTHKHVGMWGYLIWVMRVHPCMILVILCDLSAGLCAYAHPCGNGPAMHHYYTTQ